MMPRILRTPQSRIDAADIWTYIAQDNEHAADRLIDRIDEVLSRLADNPRTGSLQEQFRPGLRAFPVGNYVIFYQEITDGIEVFRILHGARNLDDLLSRDPSS
jgi:toxin ParE1/3/4